MTAVSIVRPATIQDEGELWRLYRLHHTETALFSLSERKVQYYLDRVLRPQIIPQGDCGPRGIIGVIGSDKLLEGAVMLVLGSPWYSDDITMDDCLNFVDPDHRSSNHARTLISYAIHMVDQIRQVHKTFQMMVGIVSTHRTAAKMRLYKQLLGSPIGGYFLYPPPPGFTLDDEIVRSIIPRTYVPKPPSKRLRLHRHERQALRTA